MAWWSADIQGRRRPVLQPSSRMFVALQAAASSEGVVPAFKAAQAPRTQPWPSRGLWPSPSEVRGQTNHDVPGPDGRQPLAGEADPADALVAFGVKTPTSNLHVDI
jgi:hypothetical protein